MPSVIFGDRIYRELIRLKWNSKGGTKSSRTDTLIGRGRDAENPLHTEGTVGGGGVGRRWLSESQEERAHPETSSSSTLVLNLLSSELWAGKFVLLKPLGCDTWQSEEVDMAIEWTTLTFTGSKLSWCYLLTIPRVRNMCPVQQEQFSSAFCGVDGIDSLDMEARGWPHAHTGAQVWLLVEDHSFFPHGFLFPHVSNSLWMGWCHLGSPTLFLTKTKFYLFNVVWSQLFLR